MKYNSKKPRPFDKGMGEAVAKRTILRKLRQDRKPYTKDDHQMKHPFVWENWGEVAERVAAGNVSLAPKALGHEEKRRFQDHIANGSILMSGRHLQHGDLSESTRPLEVFTNCSTASTSFLEFYLLLNGSGVGRCYDDDMMIIDWSKISFIHPVLAESHPDFDYRVHESLEQAQHKYGKYGVLTYRVQDSREGWAMALEYIENLIFEGGHENDMVLIDFSRVRPKGALIGGMQLRPSSGPIPTMNALQAIATLKGCKRPKWWQTMYVDHYMAESVLVGGARRSARIAVKHWRDPDILEFINMKNKLGSSVPLWSANNSVGVDPEFWAEHLTTGTWANSVYSAICSCAYFNRTGEPAIINLHSLEVNASKSGPQIYGSDRYEVSHGLMLLRRLEHIYRTKKYKMIVNPCGEITLSLLGGYCVIGDVVPFHCDSMHQAEEAVRLTARALMRTNLMDCVYKSEVKRTNRIGVSLTGIHEYAWKFFKLGFRDLIDFKKSVKFWLSLAHLSRAVKDECEKYAKFLKVNVPHTNTTIKPAGTTSKLFGLTEGAHLPSMREFIRWVQFRSDDPLVDKYRELGYTVKELQNYKGTSIVGFPTQPVICTLGMGDKLVTATEATPEEQYTYLMLLEQYWLNGDDHNCRTGNQISYTLKYNCTDISYTDYCTLFSKYQPLIRCCSILPTCEDDSAYEYLPEEAVSLEAYNKYLTAIKQEIEEDVDKVHIDCKGGSCPVDFEKEK